MLEVCQRQTKERRLHELRLDLWWDGFWIESAALRESLRATLDDPLEEIRELRSEVRDPYDAALTLFDRARQGRMTSPVARLLRDQTGGTRSLRAATIAVFTVAFGGEPLWDEDYVLEEGERHPRDLVAQLFGFETLGSDREQADPVEDPPSVSEELVRLRSAGVLNLERPGHVFIEASDIDLEAALLRARYLPNSLGPLSPDLEPISDPAREKLYAVSEERNTRSFRVGLIRSALLRSRREEEKRPDDLGRALEGLKRLAEVLVVIAEAFPGYKQFLGPEGTERLLAIPSEEQAAFRHDLQELLGDRPI